MSWLLLWCATAPASTIDEVLEGIVAVEKGLREGDDAQTASAGLQLRAAAAQLDEAMPRMIEARVMRAIGAGVYLAGQHGEGQDWLAEARRRDPHFRYGTADLPAGHPLRSLDLTGPIETRFPSWTQHVDPGAVWSDPAQMALERPYCVRDGHPEQKPLRLLWKYRPAITLRAGRVRYAGPNEVRDANGDPYRWICPPKWKPEL